MSSGNGCDGLQQRCFTVKKKTRQPERGGGGEKEEEEEGVGGCCVEIVREGQPRVALLCIHSSTDSFIH